MRDVIMWNMVTLDGFFEGPNPWDIDWHEYAWGDELKRFGIEQMETADMLLFGRKTYEGMATHWPTATGETADLMNSIPKVVFSRTMETADWNNTRLVHEEAEAEVGRLKQQSGKTMFILGSADLSSTLTRHGLIDEYRLALNPLVLGGGTPLFKPGPERLQLRLLEARPLESGVVILRYRPA